MKWSDLTRKERIKALIGFGLSEREAYEQADAKRISDLPGELREGAVLYMKERNAKFMEIEIKPSLLRKMKSLAKRQGEGKLRTRQDVEKFIETLVDFHF